MLLTHHCRVCSFLMLGGCFIPGADSQSGRHKLHESGGFIISMIVAMTGWGKFSSLFMDDCRVLLVRSRQVVTWAGIDLLFRYINFAERISRKYAHSGPEGYLMVFSKVCACSCKFLTSWLFGSRDGTWALMVRKTSKSHRGASIVVLALFTKSFSMGIISNLLEVLVNMTMNRIA